MFYLFKVKDKEYELRLTTKAAIEAEKRLGKNPLEIFMSVEEGRLPKMEDMMIVLHASMQKFNHGVTLDDCYDIYDDFIDEGHNPMELVQIIIDVFKASGYIQENDGKDVEAEPGEDPN